MTAIPLTRTIQCSKDDAETSLFHLEDIKKNLQSEFYTPQAINQNLSRLSTQAYVNCSDCMKVYVRIRPLNQEETARNEGHECIKVSSDDHELTHIAPVESNAFKNNRKSEAGIRSYSFSRIFTEKTSQKQFFDATTLEIVEDFITGNNALVFTYGVTNAGKTYTIQGTKGNEGIIPRAVDVIFNSIGDRLFDDSDLHLQSGNKVVLLNDSEKIRHLTTKREILDLANKLEAPSSTNTSVDTQSSQCESTINDDTCESADSSSRRRHSSFMDFTQSLADDSIVDISLQGPVKFVLLVSFIEIYNELIYDLLVPLSKSRGKKNVRQALKMGEDQNQDTFVKGARLIPVTSREEVFKIIAFGKNNLHMAETKLNHNSSRSHCIFSIKSICALTAERSAAARVAELSFCDLAGSERHDKTNSMGDRLKEAGKINSSLLTLGKCIEALRSNQQRKSAKDRQLVPYRESQLTRLFRGFLSGKGRACMLVNVNPCASTFDETAHVLRFSAIASELKARPKPQAKRSVGENRRGRPSRARKSTWQPAATPIKEEITESENAEEEEEDDEEEEGDSSDEDSSDEELDLEYWKERESRLLKAVELLRNAYKEEKENVFRRENEVRQELREECQKQFVSIEIGWEGRLDEKVKQMEELESKNQALQSELAAMDQNKREMREQLENLQTVLDANEERKFDSDLPEDTQGYIDELRQENEEGREIIHQQLQEIEELRGVVDRSRRESLLLRQEKDKIAQKEKQINDIKAEMNIITLEREDFLRTIKTLQSDNAKLKKERSSSAQAAQVQPTLSVAQATQIEEMKETLERSTEYATKLERQVDSQVSELSAKTAEIVEVNGKLEKLQVESESLSKKLTQAEAEKEILQDAVTSWKQTSEERRGKISELEARLVSVREQVEVAERKLQTSEARLAADDASLKSLQLQAAEKNEEAKMQLAKVSKEHEDQVGSLELQLKSLRDELEASDVKIQGYKKKEIETLQSDKEAHETLSRHNQVTKEKEQKIAELEKLVISLSAEVKTSNVKIQTYQVKELKAKKAASSEVDEVRSELERCAKERDEQVAQVRSELTSALVEHEKCEGRVKELETTVSSLHDRAARESDEKTELEELMKSKTREIGSLQQEVRKKSDAHNVEMKKFRERRDQLAQQLETQIANQISCNKALKEQLDQQIAKNVKLTSDNLGLRAQMQFLADSSCSKSARPASRHLQHSVKLEPPSPIAESTLHNVAETASEEEVVSMHNMSTATMTPSAHAQLPPSNDDDEENDENVDPASKSRRGSKKRAPVAKKTSSTRRKRANAPRPATPHTNDNIEEAGKPPVKRMTRGSRQTTSKISVKSEAATGSSDERNSTVTCQPEEDPSASDLVLDDSDLLRETGHSRGFPKPSLEIDVTPLQKKKPQRGRKRPTKKHENKSDEGNDEPQPSHKKLGGVGDFLKNSPVGQAFKRMEAAISPARQTEKTGQRRPRRTIKLQPDESEHEMIEQIPTVADSDVPVSPYPTRRRATRRTKK